MRGMLMFQLCLENDIKLPQISSDFNFLFRNLVKKQK